MRLLLVSMLAMLIGHDAVAADVKPSGDSPQRAVLVTGASVGIGRKVVERLAAEGYVVFAGARKEQDLKALDAIPNVKAVRLDVTIPAEVAAAVEVVRSSGTAAVRHRQQRGRRGRRSGPQHERGGLRLPDAGERVRRVSRHEGVRAAGDRLEGSHRQHKLHFGLPVRRRHVGLHDEQGSGRGVHQRAGDRAGAARRGRSSRSSPAPTTPISSSRRWRDRSRRASRPTGPP